MSDGQTYRRACDGKLRLICVRWAWCPPARGCRWCGFGSRDHAVRWCPSKGMHVWVAPTDAQVVARLSVLFPGAGPYAP